MLVLREANSSKRPVGPSSAQLLLQWAAWLKGVQVLVLVEMIQVEGSPYSSCDFTGVVASYGNADPTHFPIVSGLAAKSLLLAAPLP